MLSVRLAVYLFSFVSVATAVGTVVAHDSADSHKVLLEERWIYQVQSDDYAAWLDLTVGEPLYDCFFAGCEDRWGGPISQAINDWNSQATTITFITKPEHSNSHEVIIEVVDYIFDDPDLLGIDLPLDSNLNLCLAPDCLLFSHSLVALADAAPIGTLYDTTSSRRATTGHELGHSAALAHESVDYDCGTDATGSIPYSIMAYDCIDPIAYGGLGLLVPQPWDVCGVNHAYYDPTVGYAGCAAGFTDTPTHTPTIPTNTPQAPTSTNTSVPPTHTSTPSTPTNTPLPGATWTPIPTWTPVPTWTPAGGPPSAPTSTPMENSLLGDTSCDGRIDPVDATFILQLGAGLIPVLPCPGGGDADANGRIDIVDAAVILQYSSGIIFTIPPVPAGPTIAVGARSLPTGISGSIQVTALGMDPPGLGAWSIDVTYSSGIVEVVACTPYQGAVCNPAFSEDTVRFTGASASGLTGTTKLASIEFRCLRRGRSALTLAAPVLADAAFGDPQPLSATLLSGSITCS